MARHLDDAGQVRGYADQGAIVVKGEARIAGAGRVQVGDRELTAEHVIVATGSVADIPPIDGLDQVKVWTNREAYTTHELPRRAVLVGGSAVGIETGLFLARFGVEVTIVQRGERLLGREEPRVGELVAKYLREAGVDVRTSTSPAHARRDGGVHAPFPARGWSIPTPARSVAGRLRNGKTLTDRRDSGRGAISHSSRWCRNSRTSAFPGSTWWPSPTLTPTTSANSTTSSAPSTLTRSGCRARSVPPRPSEEALSAIEASDAAYEEPRAGAHTTVGSLVIDVVHPTELTGEAHPDTFAMRISSGSVSFLFTGDAETETEAEMVA